MRAQATAGLHLSWLLAAGARRHWMEAFAMPKNNDEMVTRICEMGFTKEDATKALEVRCHVFLLHSVKSSFAFHSQ